MTEIDSPKTAPSPPLPDRSRRLGELGLLWRFALRYPGHILAASLALFVAALSTVAIPWGFKQVIDSGFVAGGQNMDFWFKMLLGVVIVLGLATAIRFYFVSWLGERVVADLRIAVLNNLGRLSPAYFEMNRPAEIASRITADTAQIDTVVGTAISVALRNVLIGVGGIISLVYLAPKLAFMLIAAIPVMIVPIMLVGRRIRTLSTDSQDRIAQVGTLVVEVLGAAKIVQAFGQEQREAERFRLATEATFSTAKRRILVRAIMTAVAILLLFGSITFILWEGARDVQAGRMTGGAMFAFVTTGMFVAGAFGALTEVWGELLRGAGASARLNELLQVQPAITAPAHPEPLPLPPQGRIAFEAVTFHYPTRPDSAALADFSLAIDSGEKVAVVGPSGAGKSTLFQLLQRFYDPDHGVVRIDGVDLKCADPAVARSRMAMVPQETVIFAASARDNLRYGRWEADDDALWAAAEAANAAEFLRRLPQGLDTQMGEGGARLSGGQRQRLAIARALLRDAPILLLDEATSALDAESEQLVQSALERLMEGRTSIVIAHRLATVRSADRIVVMNDGRIVEQGRHDDLARGGGLYERLARLQFEGALA